MTGGVDNMGRALVRVRLTHPTSGTLAECDAWVDTGFTGDLVLPRTEVSALNSPLCARVATELGDGSTSVLDAFNGLIEWFGRWREIKIIASSGNVPLIGVGLLNGHLVSIDYRTGTLVID